MTDISPEAVERLAQLAEAAIGFAYLAAGEGLSISGVSPEDFFSDLVDGDDWDTADKRIAATLRALAAERDRLRAERDECQSERLEQARLLGISAERELRLIAERDAAWQAGAEAMRAAALEEIDDTTVSAEEARPLLSVWLRLRALPIPDKEGEA